MSAGRTAAIAMALTLAAGPAAADQPPRAPKSGGVATGYAIGGTLAGMALLAAGGALESESLSIVGVGATVIGPSAGHIYAGEGSHALITSGVRAGATVAFIAGVTMSLCVFECEDIPDDQRRNGQLLAIGGLGLYAATTLYDILDAHQAARRTNRQAAVAAAPGILTSAGGHRTPGVVLTGAF